MKMGAWMLLLGAAAAVLAHGAHAAECRMPTDAYPPAAERALRWETLNLDDPPATRWNHILAPMADKIVTMIDQVIDLIPEPLRDELLKDIDTKAPGWVASLPYPFNEEIAGIANGTGIDMGRLFLFNIAYELEGGCTSIVAQDSNGQLVHARNLDFGLFLGWDKGNQTWALAEKLRPLLFNARVMKGGANIYNATIFGGFVGLLTGAKKGGFSITVDTRFDNEFYRGLYQWLHGDHTGHFLAATTRMVMETNQTYAQALTALTTTKMVGPSFIILGGVNAGEGAVITRSSTESLHLVTLANNLKNGTSFVLETNYDNWVEPPFFDDRRNPGIACMDKIGPSGTSFAGLFNVLSGKPNLNMLTTYTTLMSTATGAFEAYTQQCELPCPMW